VTSIYYHLLEKSPRIPKITCLECVRTFDRYMVEWQFPTFELYD